MDKEQEKKAVFIESVMDKVEKLKDDLEASIDLNHEYNQDKSKDLLKATLKQGVANEIIGDFHEEMEEFLNDQNY